MMVKAPDNKVIDFGDLPADQVTSAMQKLYPPQTPSSAQLDTPAMSAVRSVGMGAQAGLEGLGQVYDVARLPFNMVGANIPSAVQQIRAASPFKPETGVENLASDMTRGATQAGASLLAGAGMAGSASPIISSIGRVLSTSPATQLASGTTSEASRGMAERAGGGQGIQLAASIAGGFAPSLAATGIDAGWRAVKGAVQPLFQGGREQIVGNTLNNAASDSQAAMDNLGNTKIFVPGAQPTTAEASQDYGLMGLQKGVKNQNPSPFAERASQQNSARNIMLNGVAEHDAALSAAKTERDAVTGPMRDASFVNAKPASISPINKTISDIMDSPQGKIEAVEKAMKWVSSRLSGETTTATAEKSVQSSILDNSGSPITKTIPAQDAVGADPQRLYSVRKDVNDAMQGKFSQDHPFLRLAKSQLKIVKDAIDQAIESGARGYKDYLSKYREMSVPINQMEVGQDIKSRVMQTAPDTTGYDFISQPKWSNVVQANRSELARTLSPKQMDIMDNITADLDRGATLNNSAIKPAGSDTFQNMSLANMLGNFLGNKGMNPLTGSLGRAFSWAYKLPDQAINQLMVDAMLDPMLSRQLMQKATTSTAQSFGETLKKRAIATGLGTFMGTAGSQNRQQVSR